LKTDKHIIQRQVFEMQGDSKRPGFEWEQSVANHHRTVIAPGIEECFDALPPTDEHLIIDSIEIDLGTFTQESFVKEARERLVQLLGERLLECRKKAAVPETAPVVRGYSTVNVSPDAVLPERVLHADMADAEALLYFLSEGRLPWWFTAGERLFNTNIFSRQFIPRLQQLLFGNKAALTRAVNHFPDEMMLEFLHQAGLHGVAAKEEWDVFAGIARKDTSTFTYFRERFWTARVNAAQETLSGETILLLFSTLNKEIISEIYAACAERKDHEAFRQYAFYLEPLTDGLSEQGTHHSDPAQAGPDKQGGNKECPGTKGEDTVNGTFSSHEQSGEKQRTRTSQDSGETANTLTPAQTGQENEPAFPVPRKPALDEALYVEAAGLILLHPFLAELFSSTGLWKDKQWTTEAAPFRAVRLMAYLAYGSSEVPEYRLVFHKILAGLDAATPLPAEAPLLPGEIATCTELLDAVLGHWTALRNTTADGLREGFLVRNGKLEQTPKGIKLDMERLAQDVLLARLPWGCSTVKLPWLEPLLLVNWM
jgi:hypothetical protein